MLSITEISNKPITILKNSTISDVIKKLLEFKISRLIVVESGNPVGIITEKDIAKSVSIFSRKPIGKILVMDIMSKNLVTVPIDASIQDCAKQMKNHGISSVVVINERGKLIGIVTKTDLVSTFLVQSTVSLPITKIMTKKVITVSPDESIFEVESVLFNNEIRRVIVTKDKSPVGIITYRDFIPAKTFDVYKEFTDPAERAEIAQSSQINEFNVNRLSYLLTFSARDIMTKNPFIAYSDDVVYTAAILMIRHGISGIPVVKNKKLVGIVTKTDIVNVLADVSITD